MWNQIKSNRINCPIRKMGGGLKGAFFAFLNDVKDASKFRALIKVKHSRNRNTKLKKFELEKVEKAEENFKEDIKIEKVQFVKNIKLQQFDLGMEKPANGLSCFKPKESDENNFYHCLEMDQDEVILEEIPLSESIIIDADNVYPKNLIGENLKDFFNGLVGKVEGNSKGLFGRYGTYEIGGMRMTGGERIEKISIAVNKINFA